MVNEFVGIGMRLTDSLIKEDVSIYISKPEIEKIFCEAPIWNETSWINTSLTINVRGKLVNS